MNDFQVSQQIIAELTAERDQLLAIIEGAKQKLISAQGQFQALKQKYEALMVTALSTLIEPGADLELTVEQLKLATATLRIEIAPASNGAAVLRIVPKNGPQQAPEEEAASGEG